MSQQRPDLLKNLPSLDDLPSWDQIKQHPQVQAWGERFAQSSVASQLQTLVQQLASDDPDSALRSPRAGVSTLFELASKLLGADAKSSSAPFINATGMLVDSQWESVPVPQNVQQALLHAARHYTLRANSAASDDAAIGLAQYANLAELAGCEAAWACHSYESALFLTCDSIARNKELLIARGRLGRTPGGDSPDEIAQQATARWREVGVADCATESDFAQAINDQTGAICTEHSPLFQVAGTTSSVALEQLASLAHNHELPCIAFLNQGAVWSEPFGNEPTGANREAVATETSETLPPLSVAESVQRSIAAGADLVVIAGAGLFGGPPSGLMFGNQRWLARIAQHPLARGCRLDSWREAALQQTAINQRETAKTFIAPADSVAALWLTATENLQNRAERLSAQLQDLPFLASAQSRSEESHITPSGTSGYRKSTYVVELTPAEETATQHAERLRQATPAILTRTSGNSVIIDLRSVSAAQDSQIVDAIRSL